MMMIGNNLSPESAETGLGWSGPSKLTYSRDLIKGALHPYIEDTELDAAVTDVIRTLAANNLHIFKSGRNNNGEL